MATRSIGVRMPTTLSISVPARTPDETNTKLRINAPGQRGILQTVVEIKKGANKMLPAFSEMRQKNKKLLVSLKPRHSNQRQLKKSLAKAKKYTDRLLTSDFKGDEKLQLKTLKALATVIDRAKIANHLLTSDAEEAGVEQLRTAIATTNERAQEFSEGLKRIETVAESWKDVGWTTNNSTAVGRGPPGYIAYSPFAQYKLPYDVNEVRKVNEEASKRTR